MAKTPLTVVGAEKLRAELQELKAVQRPAIIAAIAEARAHGDLSENAEYHAARERQSFIEGRILELEDIISRADVIDLSKLSGKTVRFGAFVTLADDDGEWEDVIAPEEAVSVYVLMAKVALIVWALSTEVKRKVVTDKYKEMLDSLYETEDVRLEAK